MNTLKEIRIRNHISQRELARRCGMSYKTIQLMESSKHDMRLSSLIKVAQAFNLPAGGIENVLTAFFEEDSNSFYSASLKIIKDGFDSWKIHLFNAVDDFRRQPSVFLIKSSPVQDLDKRLQALFAATVETLTEKFNIALPNWTDSIHSLNVPWFVSGIENLKAIALAESPLHFRKRNIFVFENFLRRA